MKQAFTVFLFALWFSNSFGQGFVIDSFISTMKIEKNGLVHVQEKIYVDFYESKRGIYRNIPYKFKNQGKKYVTDISDLQCNNNEYKVSKSNGNKVLRIGNKNRYVTGKQYYDITYTVEGPFINSDNFQEFYWNVTGSDWKAPINKASFYVFLPDDTKIRYNDLVIYTGMEGSQGKDATIQQVNQVIMGQTNRTLTEGEGLTLAIKLPKAYITGKTMEAAKEFKRPESFPKSQWPAGLIPAGLIAALFAFWNRIKKINPVDNDASDELAYYPPLELNPAETGAFHDGIVHDRDVMSLLPYWANQGIIKVEKTADDIQFIKLKELEGERPQYEFTLFNELFRNRSSVYLDDIKYQFATTIYKVKSEIHKEIVELKLYDDDYRYWFRSWRWWILIPLCIPFIILSFALDYWLAALGFMVVMVTVIVIGSLNQKKSQLGVNIKRKIDAFYRFMKLKDDTKFGEVAQADDQYFEKVYPYAVALNLDKNFTQRMKPYRQSYPYWYVPYYMAGSSPNGTGFEQFTIDYSPKEISSAFTMVKSSGGSGGSGGGGFSGGGFGGGGGGSW